MILLTVGTQFPFDRLVMAMDRAVGEGLVPGPVVAQIGDSQFKPKHLEWTPHLTAAEFRRAVAGCKGLVAHAGIGSILAGLEAAKPIVVFPRLRRYGEAVNDHQVLTASRFSRAGKILFASDESELIVHLGHLDSFVPVTSESGLQAVAERLRAFLRQRHETPSSRS